MPAARAAARPRCPDMELAPPRDYDPAVLAPSEGEPRDVTQSKEFVLLLGLAYNDLKALAWVDEQLRKGDPGWKSAPNHADPYSGNWVGTRKTFDRLASGVVHEMYCLVRRYAHAKLFETELFRGAVRRLPSRHRKAWAAFVEDTQHPKSLRLRTYNDALRNTVGYHYSKAGPAMVEGYRAHVAWKSGNPLSDRAWVSFGKNMEETRFYFSDAAAVQVQARIAREAGKVTLDERKRNVVNLNMAIRMLMESLLNELAALAAAVPEHPVPGSGR